MNCQRLLVLALGLAWTTGVVFAQPGNALVRVVHVSTDAPAVDVLLNNSVVLTSLPYRGYSDFLPVPAGTHQVSVNLAGTATEVLRQTFTLQGETLYTILAIGRVDNHTLVLRAMGDDQTDPAEGSAKVRVVHAASKVPPVDVYLTSPYVNLAGQTPALTNVPFSVYTTHLTVPAGLYQGRVAAAGTKTVAIDSGPLRLKSREIRTLIAVDPGKEGGPFDIVVLADKN